LDSKLKFFNFELLMSFLQTQLPTDTWVAASWEEYIQAIASPVYEKAKCYYHNRQYQIEMSPVCANHSDDNGIIVILVKLFGIAKALPMRLLVNCSYGLLGVRECQPDASYYIAERVKLAPKGSSVVYLDSNPPPDLAIEIADSSLVDDRGRKGIIYEEIKVAEYWVVDVKQAEIIAFKMLAAGGSQRTTESQVLPGLKLPCWRRVYSDPAKWIILKSASGF